MALSGVIYGTTNGIRVKAKLVWSATQDIAGNSSTITAKLYYYKENYGTTATGGSWNGSITIDGQRFNGSSGVISLKPGGSDVLAYTAKKVVYHNSDGSKTLSISASGALPPSSVTSTDLSGTITLDNIPRQATLLSAPDFNDEENPTITYSNPAGNAVTNLQACISFDGTRDDIPYRPISKTGKSYTFHLTEEERNKLRNNTSGNSRRVIFYIRTTIGEKIVHSKLPRTLTIVNAQPTLSPTVYDTKQESVDATGNKNKIVLNASHAYFKTGAAAKKGATIVSQGVRVGSKSASGASGTVVEPDSGEFQFYATDSRGNTVYRTVKKEVIPYVRPTVRLSTKYEFATENTINITLTIKGKYYKGAFGVKNNLLRTGYMYKTDNGAFGAWTYNTFTITYGSNNDYTATVTVNGLDYKSLYTFTVAVRDEIFSWTYDKNNPVKAEPVFDWSNRNFKFYVPAFYGEDPIAYYPVGSIYLSVNEASPASLFGGSWIRILGRFLLGVGEAYPNTDNFFGQMSGVQWSPGVGSRGGQDFHVLTVPEMPAHNHNIQIAGDAPQATSVLNWAFHSTSRVYDGTDMVRNAGGGEKHNNMPPYFAVYMWMRKA